MKKIKLKVDSTDYGIIINGLVEFRNKLIAEKRDLSARYISDIENENGNIPIDTLENIANVLKVEPYMLLKETKHKKIPKRVNMKN